MEGPGQAKGGRAAWLLQPRRRAEATGRSLYSGLKVQELHYPGFVVTGVGAWWGLGEGTQVPLVAQDRAASLLGDPDWALRTPNGLLLPRSPGT